MNIWESVTIHLLTNLIFSIEKFFESYDMHIANFLDLLPPELIQFILIYLPDQDLKHVSSINDIWKREANHEQSKRIILTDFRFRIDVSANVNLISKKIVKIAYTTDNSILRVNGFLGESYSTLGKVDLHIILIDGEKHKIIPTKFIVIGSDWPDQFPEILLGSPWMRENSVSLNICNLTLTIDNNFAIPLLM
jgi:hypothetical protein